MILTWIASPLRDVYRFCQTRHFSPIVMLWILNSFGEIILSLCRKIPSLCEKCFVKSYEVLNFINRLPRIFTLIMPEMKVNPSMIKINQICIILLKVAMWIRNIAIKRVARVVEKFFFQIYFHSIWRFRPNLWN